MSSVYMSAVCMRASSASRCCSQARMFADEVSKLKTQKNKEDSAEALGDVFRDEGKPVLVREARVAEQQESGQGREPVLRRREAEVREAVRQVVSDDEDVVVGKACSEAEERMVVSQVTRRGLLFEGMGNGREISLIEGTTTPESSARCLRGAPASVVDRQRSGSNLRGVARRDKSCK
eukprot:6198161-Pleurochrysis_carterae.AAC.2